MKAIYVAAPGRAIPKGWPEDGRPINDLDQFERNLVRDGDLIEAKPVKTTKKD
jgi:hypothetical protein